MASPLLDQLINDIRTGMKAGEKDRVTALRTLHANIKDATTNAGRDPTDADFAAVLAKGIKQRQDSFTQFTDAGRHDLAAKETAELAWLRAYQPEQLTEAQIETLARAAIASSGASSKKDMGKVMAALMPDVKGKADGKLVNQVVQRLLP